MDAQTQKYRHIFRATSLFAGAQILVILIGLIRSKFIAHYLGPTGFGLTGLLTAPLNLISTITSLGISYSAVRNISIAFESSSSEALGREFSAFATWLNITSSLGVIVCIILAPYLSVATWGSYDNTWIFVLLAFSIYFTTRAGGQEAYLRGIRQLSSSAKAMVLGPLISLITAIPMFIIMGVSSIPWVLFLTSLISVIVSYFFFLKYRPTKVIIPLRQRLLAGGSMVRLGFVMTLAGLFTQLLTYLIYLYISKVDGVESVGYFNAGWSMSIQSVGLVFAAMGADYFPRLSAASTVNERSFIVNQQLEIITLVLTPTLLAITLLLPIIVPILFSEKFSPIISFVRLLTYGMFFRGVAWVVATLPGASGDTKLFLVIEIIGFLLSVVLFGLGYSYNKLDGLAYGFILCYFIYSIVVIGVAFKRYGFYLSDQNLKILSACLAFLLCAFWSNYSQYSTLLGIVLLFISIIYTGFELNKRLKFI